MGGTRQALIIAASKYEDPELKQLRAPAADARALAGVLGDPAIGNFTVTSLNDEPAYLLSERIEDFFVDRSPEDLLLLHLSCHGVKDESGDLYFATATTKRRRLAATAISAEYIKRLMGRSMARRIVLLLDCCYSGAFEQGMLQRSDTAINMDHFAAGRGRAVITASSSMEYAFEGGAAEALTVTEPSVFTGALVRGLTSGDADLNEDGLITVEELYHFVADEVRKATPHQTPRLSMVGMQDQLVIAHRKGPPPIAHLPEDVVSALSSELPSVRMAVIPELARMLHGRQMSLAGAARDALEALRTDDSGRVRAEASRVLAGARIAPATRLDPTRIPTDVRPEHTAPPPSEHQPADQQRAGQQRPEQQRSDRRVPVQSAVAVSAYAAIALALVIRFTMSSTGIGELAGGWLRPGTAGSVLALAIAVVIMTVGRFRLDGVRAGLMTGVALATCRAFVEAAWIGDNTSSPAGFEIERVVLGLLLLGCAVWALALARQPDRSPRDSERRSPLLLGLACAAMLFDLVSIYYPWDFNDFVAGVLPYVLIAVPVAVLAFARLPDRRPSYRTASAVVAGAMLVEMFRPLSWLLSFAHHPHAHHSAGIIAIDVAATVLLGLTALLAGLATVRADRATRRAPAGTPFAAPAGTTRSTYR